MTKSLYHIFLLVFVVTLARPVVAGAQQSLPMIKASSKTVSIRDGNHFRKDYWSIMPEKKPDYYYAEIPGSGNKVTFITDQDSITFTTTYGQHYDFIILLNGKDSCYTRISATYRDFNHFTQKHPKKGPDTIPFTLGDNRKIYVTATLNGSAVKNIQLDLGAGGTVVNESSVKKIKMNFDQKVNLANSDGIHQVEASSKNLLQIGNLVWDSLSIAVARNMKPHEDLIIGNYLFKDKILEINYDKKVLVVHDSLPSSLSSYSKHDFILDGGVIPYIQVALDVRGKRQTGWAMFDTGARTSILNSNDVSMAYRIFCQLAGMVGLGHLLSPELSISKYQLLGFEYKTRDMDGPGLSMILGNDLLKRFNLVFDNKHGQLYMKPNSMMNASYGKPDEYYVVRAAVGIILLIGLTIWLLKRRNSRRSLHKSST